MLFVALAVLVAGAVAQSSFSGYQYVFQQGEYTFAAAEAACATLGGSLATPATRAANNFIIAHLPSNGTLYWVGAQRANNDASLPYQFVDGSQFRILQDYQGCTLDVNCLWECAEHKHAPNGNCVVIGENPSQDSRPAWHTADCAATANLLCQIPRLCSRQSMIQTLMQFSQNRVLSSTLPRARTTLAHSTATRVCSRTLASRHARAVTRLPMPGPSNVRRMARGTEPAEMQA